MPPQLHPGHMLDELARDVAVLFPATKLELESLLRAYEPDVVVCWGFAWKIPPEALTVPRLGSVNLHPALLPRHRGPIPMAWALREGDTHFGLTWHRMDADFDTGPILAQARCRSQTTTPRSSRSGQSCCRPRAACCRASSSASRRATRVIRRTIRSRAGPARSTRTTRPSTGRNLPARSMTRCARGISPSSCHASRADRGARRRAREALRDEPHRPGRRRAPRGDRQRPALDRFCGARGLTHERGVAAGVSL